MKTKDELHTQIREITRTSESLAFHLESLTLLGQLNSVLGLGVEYDPALYPKNHNDYLGSEHWRKFRLDIVKERAHCEVCNSYYKLHLHHKHYRTIGRETGSDVTLLCKPCHSFVHPYSRHLFPYEYSNDKDYIALPYWFMNDYLPGMSGNDFKVFCTIMCFNARRKRKIKQDKIAEYCGVNKKGVQHCLKNLERKGLVRIDRREKVNRYYHQLDKLIPPDVQAIIDKKK